MNILKTLLLGLTILAATATPALAGDFGWIKDLNVEAKLDSSGFKARLETRFEIGGVEVNAVLSNIEDPADAYMVLKLGEMSNKPTEEVIEQYNASRDKGWGVLAKSLGIKPGSKEFHALKRGHDLPGGSDKKTEKHKGKGRGKGRK